MIVASPCAVVLATMPPLLSAIANAGRHGVLVKSAVVMERAGQTDAVALDKTGTLTEGVPRVTDVRPLGARHLTCGDEATADAVAAVAGLEQRGQTAVLVSADAVPAGVLGITDRLRPDAAATIAAMDSLTGTTPILVTGDNPRAAAHLAAEAGITDVRAGLLPQDKVTAVRDLEHTGRKVLVLGDGVNDAPALAAAHTGIAMGKAGSDLALETADAVIVRDELAAVPAVVALSAASAAWSSRTFADARPAQLLNHGFAGRFSSLAGPPRLVRGPAGGRRSSSRRGRRLPGPR